jgi:hypothetical protein
MHVFLDDSGDAGMKFESGSTRFLIMSACVFDEPSEIERAAKAINECRESLGRSARWEFKHAKTSDDVKDEFFRVIRPLKFRIRAIVIDKQQLYSTQLKTAPKYLQNFAIKELLTHTLGTVKNAKLVIDGRDTKAFRLTNATYFRNEINRVAPDTIRAVTGEDSHRNALIQLADMTAGAIHRSRRGDRECNPEHMASLKPRFKYPGGSLWLFK